VSGRHGQIHGELRREVAACDPTYPVGAEKARQR
jgi:hypothetical protein